MESSIEAELDESYRVSTGLPLPGPVQASAPDVKVIFPNWSSDEVALWPQPFNGCPLNSVPAELSPHSLASIQDPHGVASGSLSSLIF